MLRVIPPRPSRGAGRDLENFHEIPGQARDDVLLPGMTFLLPGMTFFNSG